MQNWYPTGTGCVRTNSHGIEYEEVTCLYPGLKRWHLPAELSYDPYSTFHFMVDHSFVPLLAIFLYAAMIVLGQKYFANRKPWNLRKALAFWNLGLSLFSVIGFARTAPRLLHSLLHYSLTENLCLSGESNAGSGTTGLWMQLFVLSKFPELFDTFFIIVHKKPLLFLHWYHHISVLLYCWYSYVAKSPAGIIFGVMNYAVHSIMYFYYFLMAVGKKPKAFNALYITMAQISQMIVGVAVTGFGCYLLWVRREENCHLTPGNNVAALIMYGSYLLLFLEFFLQRYFGTKKSRKNLGGLSENTGPHSNKPTTNGDGREKAE